MLASAVGHHYSLPMTEGIHYSGALPKKASVYKSLYLEREDLNQKDVRLRTFIFWPRWTPKSVTTKSMAEAGLYFTGDRDEVKCFECKAVLGNWKEGEVALERHRLSSPNCPFLAASRHIDNDLVTDGESQQVGDNEEVEDEDCVDGADFMVRTEAVLKSGFEEFVQTQTVEQTQPFKNLPPNPFDKNRLKHENEKLRKAMMCRKCKKERIQTLFLPCRHLITCEACADEIDDCIECNERILGTVRTYMV